MYSEATQHPVMLTVAVGMWVAAAGLIFPAHLSSNDVSLWTASSTTVRPSALQARGVLPSMRSRSSTLRASLNEEPVDQATAAAVGAAGFATMAQDNIIPLPLALTGMGVSLVAMILAFFKPPTKGPQVALAGAAPVVPQSEQLELGKLFAQPMQMAGAPVIGDKLSPAQMKTASHVCADCGFIYALPKAFEDQPDNYKCPLCAAGKNRFATYDPVSGQKGSVGIPLYLILSVAFSAGFLGLIVWFGLSRGGH